MLAAVRSIAKVPARARAMCTAAGPKPFFFSQDMNVPRATGALRNVIGTSGSAEVVVGSPRAGASLFRAMLLAGHPHSEDIEAVTLKLNGDLHLGENQYSLQGNVSFGELPEVGEDSMKVGHRTSSGGLAGAIAARLREGTAVAVDSIGWRNFNKAVIGTFLAQRFMDEEAGVIDMYVTRGSELEDGRFGLRLVASWNPKARRPAINEELIVTRQPRDRSHNEDA